MPKLPVLTRPQLTISKLSQNLTFKVQALKTNLRATLQLLFVFWVSVSRFAFPNWFIDFETTKSAEQTQWLTLLALFQSLKSQPWLEKCPKVKLNAPQKMSWDSLLVGLWEQWRSCVSQEVGFLLVLGHSLNDFRLRAKFGLFDCQFSISNFRCKVRLKEDRRFYLRIFFGWTILKKWSVFEM